MLLPGPYPHSRGNPVTQDFSKTTDFALKGYSGRNGGSGQMEYPSHPERSLATVDGYAVIIQREKMNLIILEL